MTTPAVTTRPHPRYLMGAMNLIVIILSAMLIVWISYDTFQHVDFLLSTPYMTFQLWVCIFFIIDFFIGLWYAPDRGSFLRRRWIFLVLSIPYLNLINHYDIHLSADAIYFVRFVPLARGALAMSIVMGYLSTNAISSLFMSYIVIMLAVGYFCSLIFYQREYGVNPEVTSYWIALWWSAMNMSTVGCDISPATTAGKIVAVVLPIVGMVIFPLFTVYLTNYVTNAVNKERENHSDK